MLLIRSLNEVNANQLLFPLFFHDDWLKTEGEIHENAEILIFFDKILQVFVPLIIYKLRILKKADYLFVPLNFNGEELSEKTELLFLNKFHDYIKRENICDVIFPPSHYCNFKCIPNKVKYFKLGIIWIDLKSPVEEIFNKMSSNYRNEIRKAQKVNLHTLFGNEYLMQFYKLYEETQIRNRLIYDPLCYLEKITKYLPNNVLIGLSIYNKVIENSILNVFDRYNTYYLYSGSQKKNDLPGSNKLLLWETIKYFKSIGIRKYILGGYRNPQKTDLKHNGIQDFKLRFGAEIEQGYHFVKIINPFKYYCFLIALKCKSVIFMKEYSFMNKSGLEIKQSK